MLTDFKELLSKYKVKAKGILHVGANTGQEAKAYQENGIEQVIWIEAIPEVFKQLLDHVDGIPNTLCINACVGDVDGKKVTFHVSNNEAQSSSFLELGTHKDVHPTVVYERDFECTMIRLYTLFFQTGLNIEDFTFLNMDLQGAELFALKGMGPLLHKTDYAYLEVNKEPLYVGCALIGEIDEYMEIFDFVRVETFWAGNTGWGDAFYIKNNLL